MVNTVVAPVRLSARLLSRRWAAPPYGTAFLPTLQQNRLQSTSSNLPRIIQPSTWNMIIPKLLRSRQPGDAKKEKSKEWNPASFFIIIFILIGSQAIRMMVLKSDFAAYTRRADAKIRLLKEVIEKITNGEKVNVEKMLGTGDDAKEREWEEVLREIEEEDSLWHQKATAQQSKSKDDESGRAKDNSTAKVTANTTKESSTSRTARFF
ncbi:hypothetical protein VTN00DRAFT_2100 [Thermoascus crustaceus]|uniref:uncharacterized protein n=1 Tax=Thermoascus crustaceus TaxID=5088 RepID=UPI003744193E